MAPRPESPEKEEHTALRTMMQLICHTCNQRGHMAKNCPEHLGQKVNTTTLKNHTFKPILTSPQYHAHYPIITRPLHIPFNSYHQQYPPKSSPQPDLY
ncbi:hypothetical protein O181_059361 [Austropuccinia psidii MF-1]|uniref:CCHC-type domain-containing protein n=1 Tax=Austropuccinia psidii MF-1 TaxID=1389203 RepID=A0A9Q3EC26_9BASI|nr:hypothetical protein [Austropuccinia psidii MF-1]